MRGADASSANVWLKLSLGSFALRANRLKYPAKRRLVTRRLITLAMAAARPPSLPKGGAGCLCRASSSHGDAAAQHPRLVRARVAEPGSWQPASRAGGCLDATSSGVEHVEYNAVASRTSRRALMGLAGGLAGAAWLGSIPAYAAPMVQKSRAGINEPFPIDGTEVVTLEYAFIAPVGFERAEVLPPSSTLGSVPQLLNPSGAAPTSAVVDRFVLATPSGEGCQITLAVKDASTVRPTLLQLQDVSDWGAPGEVAPVFVPLGARLTGLGDVELDRGVRDTGTLIGKVALPPRHLYRYDFSTADGRQACVGVSGRAGKLFILTASATEAQWADEGLRAKLRAAADSLRVLDKPVRAR